jgi:hypothetical protein
LAGRLTDSTRSRDVLPAFCKPIMVTSISVALRTQLLAIQSHSPAAAAGIRRLVRGNVDGGGGPDGPPCTVLLLPLTKTSSTTSHTSAGTNSPCCSCLERLRCVLYGTLRWVRYSRGMSAFKFRSSRNVWESRAEGSGRWSLVSTGETVRDVAVGWGIKIGCLNIVSAQTPEGEGLS